MRDRLKIGYFADGPWSHSAFEKIQADSRMNVAFICVRHDTSDNTLMGYCRDYKIPYLRDSDINSENFINEIEKFNADIFVSMSFNQIFRDRIINIPPLKTINCHAGKLPFYRGRNILNWALINDENEFGITVHYVDKGVDTGDIILQKTFPITDKDDYATLLDKAYSGCAEVLYKALCQILDGTADRIKQSSVDKVGFYCTQRKEGDEVLNWNQTSREIFNFIRAITKPGPCARTVINGEEMKIIKAELVKGAKNYRCINGAVLSKADGHLIVKTADSFVKITEYEYGGTVRVGDRFEQR